MNIPAGLHDNPIYLDYNATTAIDPRVAEACRPYLTEHFGTPSSGHHYGRSARAAARHHARGDRVRAAGTTARHAPR